ncbi:MAG: LysR family transcriptional regulator, partial [Clostridia bacterium]|nr:LysR family transcriptional regulator [Clostridia bacterium]
MYNHQLDAFIKVADMGSFGKAAEQMYISTPALIQQINLLESTCGFRLFERSNRGVKLTAAGYSLYDDAKTLIRFSEDALDKAKRLADRAEFTVRIGTTLLYKCRMLPDIWNKVNNIYPDLKIEIVPLSERVSRENLTKTLGFKYDFLEGVFASISQKPFVNFFQLKETPLCCAVSKNHRFAKYKSLSLPDLNSEVLLMPIQGVSSELDTFRKKIKEMYPAAKIIDSPYYGVDTFMLCEMNDYILITQEVYSDIHPNLVTIPLEDISYKLPYGLIFSLNPT